MSGKVQTKIPLAEYEAMRRICDPMMDAIGSMSAEEIVLAMKGFYAAREDNCPWYAFALRHVAPPLLATVGSGLDGYEKAYLSGRGPVIDELVRKVRDAETESQRPPLLTRSPD